jgi:hypothetical protein
MARVVGTYTLRSAAGQPLPAVLGGFAGLTTGEVVEGSVTLARDGAGGYTATYVFRTPAGDSVGVQRDRFAGRWAVEADTLVRLSFSGASTGDRVFRVAGRDTLVTPGAEDVYVRDTR